MFTKLPRVSGRLKDKSDVKRGSDMSTKLMNFTVSVSISIFSVAGIFVDIYLYNRLSNKSKIFSICAIESFLYALGDGNWKMGDTIQVGKGV